MKKRFLPIYCLSLFLLSPMFAAHAGDLLVSSVVSDNVLRYDGETGDFIEAFVPAGSGGLASPDGITFGADGNLYVFSFPPNQVLKFAGSDGAFISTLGPVDLDGEALISGPDGSLYAGDYDDDQVWRIQLDGSSAVFATGVDGPEGMVFGPDGNFYVVGFEGDNVLRFDGTTGQPIDEFVAAGSGGLDQPIDLAFGPDGNLYVSTYSDSAVRRYDGSTGAFLNVFVPPSSGGLDVAFGMFFRSDGNLYVASLKGNAILRFNATTGAFVDEFVAAGDGGLDDPTFFTFFPAGELAFSANNYSIDEDAGTAVIQVNRSNGANGAVTVQLTTSNGSAAAGIDYSDVSQVLSFAEGETSQTVSIPIIDNDVTGNNSKTVNLILSDPTNDATLGVISTAVLTILDDDAPVNPPNRLGGGGACQLGSAGFPGAACLALLPVLAAAFLRIRKAKP